ncbi:hypothetical protein HDU86_006308 [Geranomyces michiganensis]|nr:hypothetical protein HDU86_006308 [Geranomyces michiganensis]
MEPVLPAILRVQEPHAEGAHGVSAPACPTTPPQNVGAEEEISKQFSFSMAYAVEQTARMKSSLAQWEQPTVALNFTLVILTLQELPLVTAALNALDELCAEGKLAAQGESGHCIDVLTATGSIVVVSTYPPTPARGSGSQPQRPT